MYNFYMKPIYKYNVVFKDNNNPDENIIFCHGLNSTADRFDIFKNYWTKSNYYALQFPASNLTPVLEGDEPSVFCFARLVVEFVEKNNLKNVTLIGHSLGGGTISLAYQMRPDLFKKLVYIAPMNKPALALYDRYKKDYFPQDYEGFLDLMRSLYYDISKFTSDPEWVKEQKESFDPYLYNNPDIVKLGTPDMRVFEAIEETLKIIKVPTILILGEKDGVILRQECIDYFKKYVQNVEIHWIPKTGHMMYLEDWNSFINILEPFLGK